MARTAINPYQVTPRGVRAERKQSRLWLLLLVGVAAGVFFYLDELSGLLPAGAGARGLRGVGGASLRGAAASPEQHSGNAAAKHWNALLNPGAASGAGAKAGGGAVAAAAAHGPSGRGAAAGSAAAAAEAEHSQQAAAVRAAEQAAAAAKKAAADAMAEAKKTAAAELAAAKKKAAQTPEEPATVEA